MMNASHTHVAIKILAAFKALQPVQSIPKYWDTAKLQGISKFRTASQRPDNTEANKWLCTNIMKQNPSQHKLQWWLLQIWVAHGIGLRWIGGYHSGGYEDIVMWRGDL